MYYYNILTKKTFTKLSSIKAQWSDFKKFLSFFFKPLIWSRGKFRKLNINPKTLAVLQTASLLVLVLPIFFLRFFKNLLLGLWLVSFSVMFTLLHVPYISRSSLMKIQKFGNTWKRMRHNFFLTRELVEAGKLEPQPLFQWNRPKVPINRVLNSSILFDRWLRGLKFSKPIQFLNERVILKSNDDLPAVKTAVKCLSSLNKDYLKFNTQVMRELKRIQKSKLEKSKVTVKENK
jgi:hypothetical protein